MVFELGELFRGMGTVRQEGLRTRSILTLKPSHGLEPVFELLKSGGIVLNAASVLPQVSRDLLELGSRLGEQFSRTAQAGVDLGRVCELLP